MPFQRKRSLLVLGEKEVEFLEKLAGSRTEPYSKVKRAKMLLAYCRGESISSIARKEQTDRPVVERCVDKALSGGIMTALRDLARSGRPSVITDEDKAWVIHLACSKPSDYGYAAERWTIAQLARHIREQAIENGHPSLTRMGKSGLHNILRGAEIKAHKTAYYLERRDTDFEEKMAQVLVVYKEVQQARGGAIRKRKPSSPMMKSQAFKPLQTSLPIWLRSVENMPPGVELMNTNAREPFPSWPVLICTTDTS
jgi:transposase